VCVFAVVSNYSSPVKKVSKKRKVVIDDDDADGDDEAERGLKDDDDLFDIASLHDDSDVCHCVALSVVV